MSKIETNNFNYIVSDFSSISGICLYSDRCGPRELQRLDEACKRNPKRMTLSEFLIKNDSLKSGEISGSNTSKNNANNSPTSGT